MDDVTLAFVFGLAAFIIGTFWTVWTWLDNFDWQSWPDD